MQMSSSSCLSFRVSSSSGLIRIPDGSAVIDLGSRTRKAETCRSQRHTKGGQSSSSCQITCSSRVEEAESEAQSAVAAAPTSTPKNWLAQTRKAAAAGLTALYMIMPIPIEMPVMTHHPLPTTNQTGTLSPMNNPMPAKAVLLSPSTQLPKNAEVALRRAVPVVNQSLRKVQDGLEEIFVLLRIPQRKPYGTMEASVKKALKLAEEEKGALIAAVPAGQQDAARELLDSILTGEKNGLPGLLTAILAKDPDAVSIRLASSLNMISQLAVLQAPGLPYLLPAQYADLPRLTGRAVVEFEVLKADGSTFSIKNGAESTKTGQLTVVLDGYSAPLTAGNFAKLVSNREYDGVAVKANQQFVLGDARNLASNGTPSLPLELMPTGEFQPVYRTPLDISDGELPVLPMSVFGALVASHSPESDSLSSPTQFFFFLYDKRNSGLGGLAFDEGQFAVFGYLTGGKDILSQLRTGDVIQSAKLTSGSDRLVFPTASEVPASESEIAS